MDSERKHELDRQIEEARSPSGILPPGWVNLELLEWRVKVLEKKSDQTTALISTTLVASLGSCIMLIVILISHGGHV